MKEFTSRRLRVWENINRTMQEFKVLLLGYRSYTALLTQTGTNAPVATVLENTLGIDVSLGYESPGEYAFNFSKNILEDTVDNFPRTNFTVLSGCLNDGGSVGGVPVIFAYYTTPSKITFGIYKAQTNQKLDDFMQNLYFEIRVYN